MSTSIQGSFNFPTSYRIGAGRSRELGAACRDLGLTRPLIVTDPGVRALAWFKSLVESLTSAGVEADVFSEVGANPTEEHVSLGLERYRNGKHSGVVLIGGGSAMDVGKCIALLADNPGTVFDYEDVGDNYKRADPNKIVKTIAIPTTAGTGSEVGRCSVITDLRDHSKKIIFHAKMQPSLARRPRPHARIVARPHRGNGHGRLRALLRGARPRLSSNGDGIALAGLALIKEQLPLAYREGSNVAARTHMLMAASMERPRSRRGSGSSTRGRIRSEAWPASITARRTPSSCRTSWSRTARSSSRR